MRDWSGAFAGLLEDDFNACATPVEQPAAMRRAEVNEVVSRRATIQRVRAPLAFRSCQNAEQAVPAADRTETAEVLCRLAAIWAAQAGRAVKKTDNPARTNTTPGPAIQFSHGCGASNTAPSKARPQALTFMYRRCRRRWSTTCA
jgi:hypothetical protein